MANVYNSITDLFKAIANSIRNKTGETSTIIADDFPVIINNIITLKDGSKDGTATAEDIIKGKIAYVNGQKVTGKISIQENTEIGINPITLAYSDGVFFITTAPDVVPNQYIGENVQFGINVTNKQIADVIELTADKIVNGNTVLGIIGTGTTGIDTSDATATAEDIAKGKIAYVNGEKIRGTLVPITQISGTVGYANVDNDQSRVSFSTSFSNLDIPIDADTKGIFDKSNSNSLVRLYASFDILASDIGLTADKIVKGTTILGIEGTAEVVVPNIEAKTWIRSNITEIYFNTLYYANGVWVAGSYSGSSSSLSSKGLYYSTDGKTWTQSNITVGIFYDIYYANSIWVACGNNGVYHSTDGKTWELVSSSIVFSCIKYANGVWVAGGTGNRTNIGLWYSTNGKNWTQSGIAVGGFSSVYYSDGIWVASSSSSRGLYYSTDGGYGWRNSNITENSFNFAYYIGNIWVAGSISKGLYYSTDGKTWTQSNIVDRTFYDICYVKGLYIAGSNSGIYYSTDGKNWYQSKLETSVVYNIYFYNNIWVAGSSSKGILRSEDGISWESTNVTSGKVNRILYGNGIWAAITSDGEGIWYSETTTN